MIDGNPSRSDGAAEPDRAVPIPVTYRHPRTGESWTFRPDAAGQLTLDIRVVELLLIECGYYRVQDMDTSGHGQDVS